MATTDEEEPLPADIPGVEETKSPAREEVEISLGESDDLGGAGMLAWAGNVDVEAAGASRQGATAHQESREESMAPTDRARRTALHAASRPQLCAVCHQPKRGHKCTGVYVPVRLTAANRARMNINRNLLHHSILLLPLRLQYLP